MEGNSLHGSSEILFKYCSAHLVIPQKLLEEAAHRLHSHLSIWSIIFTDRRKGCLLVQLHPSTAKRPTRIKSAIKYIFIELVGSHCLFKWASRETFDLWLTKRPYPPALGKWRQGVVVAQVGSSAGSKRYQVCRFSPHPGAWKFSQKSMIG